LHRPAPSLNPPVVSFVISFLLPALGVNAGGSRAVLL
jgi:hypothetical protein